MERKTGMEAASFKKFLFIGNNLCLDFINTEKRREGALLDLLPDFEYLIAWLLEAKVLDPAGAEKALQQWNQRAEGETLLEEALGFRAELRGMTEAIIKGKKVPQTAIDSINGILSHQAGHIELKRIRGGFKKGFQMDFSEPIRLLLPMAEAACDLLCYGDLSLIKKCENSACILFFYDTTKNHSRRWCSMKGCGNRIKVAAYYRRLRETPPV